MKNPLIDQPVTAWVGSLGSTDLHTNKPTVLGRLFNTRLVLGGIRTQTVNIKPVGDRNKCQPPCTSKLELWKSCSAYQERMDIFMFKETGMTGLQSQKPPSELE